MNLSLEDVKEEEKGLIAPCGIICLGCDSYTGEGLEAATNLIRIWEGGNVLDTSMSVGLNPDDISKTLETLNQFVEKVKGTS